MNDLHFSQLTHELDIAKHLALGHVFGVLLDFSVFIIAIAEIINHIKKNLGKKVAGKLAKFKRDISPGVLFILLGDLNAVLELHATLVEQQPLEGAGIAIRGIKIRSFFNQHFAHLCVHRRIFRLIEGFFENLKCKKTEKL